VYAWGYGEDGRLGLGDTDNDAIFESGYDTNADLSYQFVGTPELVPDLAGRMVTQVAAGEEHSACVSTACTHSRYKHATWIKLCLCVVLAGYL
jgi:hypothetical protein